jgi:hypothetical protein
MEMNGCITKWVLLDDEGSPVRYFAYPAEGTIEVKEPKYIVDWNNYEECLL